MKAIETVYNGYKFRSRLEARWAVFFDTLGIEYLYEHEGYDLDGVWHLPDFWLPKQECWIEIKPKHLVANIWNVFEPCDIDVAVRCGKLSGASGAIVYLLTGDVWHLDNWKGIMVPYLSFSGNADGDWSADHSQWWSVCSKCKSVDLCYEANADRIYCGCNARFHPGGGEMLDRAYTAARQARF